MPYDKVVEKRVMVDKIIIQERIEKVPYPVDKIVEHVVKVPVEQVIERTNPVCL